MSSFVTGTKVIAISRPDKRLNAFIQGGVINSFSMPPEIVSVQAHAFDNISDLREIIFTNPQRVVSVSADSGIGLDVTFVVPNNLLSVYQSAYPGRTVTGYAGTPPSVDQVPFELIGLGGRFTISNGIYAKSLGDGRYELLPLSSRVTSIGDGRYTINQ